ncbi:hypothetical protein FWF48_01510 [Candidatus Saccharibacteria bacterium]|nr:hypothetical protein [Candidatus Saccharibacteria bacterium]
MKKWLSFLAISSVALLVVACPVWAAETPANQKQLDMVAYRCSSVKANIKRLQTQDAITRVELGQNYESILTKLMVPMNTRLAKNSFDGGNILSITADFSSNLDNFRQHYQQYDETISDLLNIDCTKKPADFYNKLLTARAKRSDVQTDCANLSQNIKSYREELQLVTFQVN